MICCNEFDANVTHVTTLNVELLAFNLESLVPGSVEELAASQASPPQLVSVEVPIHQDLNGGHIHNDRFPL